MSLSHGLQNAWWSLTPRRDKRCSPIITDQTQPCPATSCPKIGPQELPDQAHAPDPRRARPRPYETVTRRLRLNGQSTSIRLERVFWQILDDIAARQGVTTPAFISKLHAKLLELHGEARNFNSLPRCAS